MFAAIAGYLSEIGVFGTSWQHWWGLNDPEVGEKVSNGALRLFNWFSLAGGWQVNWSRDTLRVTQRKRMEWESLSPQSSQGPG